MQQARKQKSSTNAIARMQHGLVVHDYEMRDGSPNRPGGWVPSTQVYLRQLLGDDFFDDVVWVQFDGPGDLGCLEDLSALRRLTLSRVTDEELEPVKQLKGLEELEIYQPSAADVKAMVQGGVKKRKDSDSGKSTVTPNCILEIRRAIPNCKVRLTGELSQSSPKEQKVTATKYRKFR